MKKLMILLAGMMITTILFGQQMRYTETLFDNMNVTLNVVYGSAPKLNAAYNDESNTSQMDLVMDVFEPAGDDLTLRPAIIFAHGGAFVSGNRNHDDMVAFCDTLAKKGYVTATIDYRLGMYMTSAASCTRAVYRGLQDGRSAVRYLRAHAATYGIDPTRVYFAGSSAGGFIALQSVFMNREEDKPQEAGTYTYHNPLFPFNEITAPDLGDYDIGSHLELNGTPDAIMSLWGAVQHTDIIQAGDAVPLLLVHGMADAIVPFSCGHPFGYPVFPVTYGSEPIQNQLRDLQFSPVETYFPEGEGHEFYGVSNGNWDPAPNAYWPIVVQRAVDFFYRQHRPEAGYAYETDELTVVFTNTSSGATDYHWDFGDGATSQAMNPTHVYAEPGNYRVLLHVENEIRSWHRYSAQVVVSATGWDDQVIPDPICYPNPIKDLLVIDQLPTLSQIKIFTATGQQIQNIKTNHPKTVLQTTDWPQGIYLVSIITADKQFQYRILK